MNLAIESYEPALMDFSSNSHRAGLAVSGFIQLHSSLHRYKLGNRSLRLAVSYGNTLFIYLFPRKFLRFDPR